VAYVDSSHCPLMITSVVGTLGLYGLAEMVNGSLHVQRAMWSLLWDTRPKIHSEFIGVCYERIVNRTERRPHQDPTMTI
jgi:hypothetical protein